MKDIHKIGNLNNLKPLSKPKGGKGVSICLSSDSNYEPHLWVTISSMIDSAKSNSDYYIYILDGGIKNKEAFLELINKDKRFQIEFIDMSDQFIYAFQSRNVSTAAYYRLAIFKLFKNFGKVIYLDADSYVLGDMIDLLNLPMGKKLIAGARDSITYEKPWREKYIRYSEYSGKALDYFKDYLKFSEKKLSSYFASGVLVFNLKEIDISKKQEQLDHLLLKNYFCHDQDILNLLFNEEETFILGREWNYFNSGPLLKESDFAKDEERKNYLEEKVKPKIVSYLLKPWLIENRTSPYAEEYWEVLSSSPYYLEVRNRMGKNTKIQRFMKLSFKEKGRFLTSREAFGKYKEIIKNLFKRIT